MPPGGGMPAIAGPKISITIEGLDPIMARFSGRARASAAGDFSRALTRADWEGARMLHSEIERTAPRRTGNLRWSWRFGRNVVWTNELYAFFLYVGTGVFGPLKRRIEPRPGRVGRNGRPAALRWIQNGRAMYRRSVQGMRANPYVDNAVAAMRQPIAVMYARTLAAWAAGRRGRRRA